ncbi:MAG TPA: hypothetical protein VGD37_10820 [Kofleriaceae bacterium]
MIEAVAPGPQIKTSMVPQLRPPPRTFVLIFMVFSVVSEVILNREPHNRLASARASYSVSDKNVGAAAIAAAAPDLGLDLHGDLRGF